MLSFITAILISTAFISLGIIVLKAFFKKEPDQNADLLEYLIISFGIGAGLFSIFFHLISLVLINRILLLCMLVFLNVYLIIIIKKHRGLIKFTFPEFENKIEIILYSCLGFCILMNILASYIPPIQSDVLQYHLLIPKYYILDGVIGNLSGYVKYSVFPQLIETVYLIGMILKNDVTAQFLHTFFGIGTLIIIVLFTREFLSKKTALLAGLIFYMSPVIKYLSGSAMVDLGLIFYFMLAGYVIMKWAKDGNHKWLIMFALFYAFGFGVKYTGILIAVWIPFALLIRKNIDWKKFLHTAVISFFIFSVFISPWLIKNYLQTGNPVTPFAYKIFGGSNNNEYLHKSWKSHMEGDEKFGNFSNKIKIKSRFYLDFFVSTPLLIIGWFVVFTYFRKKSRTGICLFLMTLAFMVTGVLFLPAIKRFNLQVIALFAMFSAEVIISVSGTGRSGIKKVFKYLLIIFVFIDFSNRLYEYLRTLKNWDVIFGVKTREKFLSKKFAFYNMKDYINNYLSWDDKILSLNETRGYYFNSKFIIGHETIQGYYVHTLSNMNYVTELMKRNNIYYLFISLEDYFRQHQRETLILKNNNLDKYFTLVHENEKNRLYKLN